MSRPRSTVIFTPEHVPIRLVSAGLGSRFAAIMIDLGIILALCILAQRACSALLPGSVTTAASVTISFVIWVGYHAFFEVRWDGRSPGKRAIGLRVMDERGLPLTSQQALLRNAVRTLDFLPFGYGCAAVFAFFDSAGRRLGDVVARTIVVDERGVLPRASQLPPARRFNSLRTPGVQRLARHRIGLEEREFLVTLCLRADRLAPHVRFELMEATADLFRERLDIEDPHLSGEALVRDLTALLTDTDQR